MKTTSNIKNQMRPFSDTSIYDDKPKSSATAKDEAPAEDISETPEEPEDDTANDCASVMEMSEASQLAIFDALKAKFGEQETGADNSKF